MNEEELETAPALKNCPFCGGKAEITFSGKQDLFWRGYIVAKCQTCGATSRGCFYQGEAIDIPLNTTEGAFKQADLWNRRSE